MSEPINIGDEASWPIFFFCGKLRKREFFIFINLMDVVLMNMALIFTMYLYYNDSKHPMLNILNMVVYFAWLSLAITSIAAYLISKLNFGRGIHMVYAVIRFFFSTMELIRIILEISFLIWAIKTENVEESATEREHTLYFRLAIAFPISLISWGWSYLFISMIQRQRKFNRQSQQLNERKNKWEL